MRDTCCWGLTSDEMSFESAVEVCTRLIAPRPLAAPHKLEVNLDTSSLEVATGFDRFTLTHVTSGLEWISAAHRLGGLLLRVMPSTSPDRVSLLACWEGQMITLTGIPQE